MERTKPDPARGWELLNEIADELSPDQRGAFIAESRFFEGAFTSGLITEGAYLETLQALKNNTQPPR